MKKKHADQLYVPKSNELQLTLRAVLVGCSIGGVVAAMNLYLALKTGLTFGGSLISAILSYSVFQLVSPKDPFTILEANIAQTSGSAGGAMASTCGLTACIPAMKMLGYDLSFAELLMGWLCCLPRSFLFYPLA